MTIAAARLQEVAHALLPKGILLRGVTTLGVGQGAQLSHGGLARTVLLLGNVGGSIWEEFSCWRQGYSGADPLDTWSRTVIEPIAERFNAAAVFPSDRPYHPFQQWAMRAEGLKPSPLGILIHPQYGLWHGYRGALVFSEELEPMPVAEGGHPCDSCADMPCLSACPADALVAPAFLVEPCRDHLVAEDSQTGCMRRGCAARSACPVGAQHRYPPDQLRFHMDALI
ncbi:MAG: ferredoxin [Pseudorhizobium sp.]